MTNAAKQIPVHRGFEHGTDPGLLARHRQEWDRLREETPVFRSDVADHLGYSLWYLLRYEDNLAALQNYELFSSRTVQHLGDSTHRLIPEELDPPEHTKYRRVLSHHFSPKAVRGWEGEIRRLCVSLIEELAPRGECELLTDFSQRFPTTIFLKIMGLPVDLRETFIARANTVLHERNDTDPDGSRRQAATAAIVADLAAIFAARRTERQDDLVTRLVTETIDGEPIGEEQLFAMGFLLYIAGLDTVASMLGYIFRHLAEDPALRAKLISEPGLIPDAVEEFLRLYPIATTARVVTRDTEFAGCPMRKGDRILCVTAAAGRDPREFPNPDKFVLDRSPNRHLTFGAGPHRCAGSHLARLELATAIEEWLRRIPDFRIADGAQLTEHVGAVAGLDALPLVWDR